MPPAGTSWASLPDDKREGVALWDPRTVPLCRTGHGNVHYWLTYMMHKWPSIKSNKLPPVGHFLNGEKFVRKEAGIAYLAIERWVAAGGDLMFLIDKKMYGEI
jgi:hypothetical protein